MEKKKQINQIYLPIKKNIPFLLITLIIYKKNKNKKKTYTFNFKKIFKKNKKQITYFKNKVNWKTSVKVNKI